MRPQAVEHVGALTDERMEESLAHVVTAASYLEVGQRLRNEGALSAAVVAHNNSVSDLALQWGVCCFWAVSLNSLSPLTRFPELQGTSG